MRSVLARAAIFLALGAALTACGSDNATQPNGTGQVSIALTDAPADSILSAVVTIAEVYLQPGSDSVSPANRVYLRQGVNTTVDLLTLRDSLKSLIQDAVVPAGTYQQLRLVITGAYIKVRTPAGSTSIYATSPNYGGLPPGAAVSGTLVLPSYARSGLKVLLAGGNLTVASGSSTSLVADFDLAQTFSHPAGQNGWVMSPVVRAVQQSSLATLTVNVALGTGVTLPTGVALSDFQAQLTDVGGDTRTVALNGSGSATFQMLLPVNGPFSLGLVAPAGVTLKTSTPSLPITGLVLSPGANTEAITLTSFQ